MEQTTFGGWLARELAARGYRSQRAFARAIDMDPTYLSRILNGHVQRPERETLERIADRLELPYAEVAQAAGALPDAVMPPAVPVEPTGDQAWNPAALVAWVEAHPDEQFRADLADLKAQYAGEHYVEICRSIARAWLSNGNLAIRVAREVGGRG